MTKLTILCATAAAMFAAYACALLPSRLAGLVVYASGPAQTIKIMPLGDSITYGTPDPAYGGYRRLLGRLLTDEGYSISFVGSMQSGYSMIPGSANEGHPGWTIPQLKNAIDSENWLETYLPDLILLHIGTNDLGLGDAGAAPGNLSALLDDILMRLPKAHVIVAQIISYNGTADGLHQTYNDAIAKTVATKGPRVSRANMQDLLTRNDYADGLHPNAAGYDKMARAWETAIRAIVAAPARPKKQR